jgi:hypothetical protein
MGEIMYNSDEIQNIFSAKRIALIIIFAALHTALSSLPFTIAIGVNGSITLGVITVPLMGIILGPISGGVAALIGSVIAMFVNPSGAIFGPASVLPATIGAMSAGFAFTKRGYISAGLLLAAIISFYIHPIGMEVIGYPFLHIIAVVVALVFSTRLAVWSTDLSNVKKLSVGIPVAAFVGTLNDHIVGSSLASWMFNLPVDTWNFVMVVYPIERIVAVVIVVAIALPLYYSLRKSGILNLIR